MAAMPPMRGGSKHLLSGAHEPTGSLSAMNGGFSAGRSPQSTRHGQLPSCVLPADLEPQLAYVLAHMQSMEERVMQRLETEASRSDRVIVEIRQQLAASTQQPLQQDIPKSREPLARQDQPWAADAEQAGRLAAVERRLAAAEQRFEATGALLGVLEARLDDSEAQLASGAGRGAPASFNARNARGFEADERPREAGFPLPSAHVAELGQLLQSAEAWFTLAGTAATAAEEAASAPPDPAAIAASPAATALVLRRHGAELVELRQRQRELAKRVAQLLHDGAVSVGVTTR